MAESAAQARPGSGARRWLPVAPLILALAAGANVLGNGFAGDAVPWVAGNPQLHGLGDPLGVLAAPYRADVAPEHSPWRPLTSVSFAASWSAGGGHPLAYHLADVLLHVLVTGFVLALLLALGASATAAAAGAAIFAVHPLHTEAVASIVGRADVLAACFSILGALAYLRLRGAVRVAAVALCYAGALGSKESGVVLPGLLLAIELVRTPDLRAFMREVAGAASLWLGLIGVLALYFVLRHAVLGTYTGADVAPYIAALPPALRISTALANWTTYARLLLFPMALSSDYGPAVTMPAGLDGLRFWAGSTLAVGGLLLGFALRRRHALLSLGLLWFAIAVFPVTNLLVLTPVWIAERTLYLPSVAVAFWVASLAGSAGALRVRERRLAVAALTVVVLLFGLRSWQRNRTWESSDRVARTLVRERPESFRSAWWLARMLTSAGRYDRAATLFARADSLVPGNAGIAGDYAGMLLDAGRPDAAERVLRRFPDDVSADLGIYRVRAIARQGRLEEAASEVARLRRLFPRDPRLPRMAIEVDSAIAARR